MDWRIKLSPNFLYFGNLDMTHKGEKWQGYEGDMLESTA